MTIDASTMMSFNMQLILNQGNKLFCLESQDKSLFENTMKWLMLIEILNLKTKNYLFYKNENLRIV